MSAPPASAPSLAGDITEVGPTFVSQSLSARARLDDGETAIIGLNRRKVEAIGQTGVPWLSSIPFLGWLFRADGENVEDARLVFAVRARRISSPAELAAESIRRRLAFQRRTARGATLPRIEGPPYGVRVVTRQREDDARAIADGLARRGHQSVVHAWTLGDEELFDVYITALESMADAAEIAFGLSKDGWSADLVVLPTRS